MHPQTALLYHNSSVWLDTRDASIKTQLTLHQSNILHLGYRQSQHKQRDVFRYTFICTLSVTGGLNS